MKTTSCTESQLKILYFTLLKAGRLRVGPYLYKQRLVNRLQMPSFFLRSLFWMLGRLHGTPHLAGTSFLLCPQSRFRGRGRPSVIQNALLFYLSSNHHLTTPSLSYSKTFRRRRNHSLPHGDLPLSEVCRLRSALSSSFRLRFCRGLGRAVCLPSNHPCICEAMRLKSKRDHQQVPVSTGPSKGPMTMPFIMFPFAFVLVSVGVGVLDWFVKIN